MKHRTFRAAGSLIAAIAVIAAVVTGCGSSTDDSSSASATVTAENGALPATIVHKFGETTVTKVPERVVSLGYTDQDALLALGIVPVAVRNWDGMAAKDSAVGAWAQSYLKGQKPQIDNAEQVDPEAIAAMRPDLIVAVYSGIDKNTYEALSKIAPVIAQKAEYADYQQPWDVTTIEIGAAVGLPAKAKELVDGVTAKIAALAAKNPSWKGKTLTVATYDGSSLSAFSSADPRSRFFTSLGFAPNTQVDTAAGSEFYATLSLEEAQKISTDVIVWDQLSYAPKGKQAILDQTALANLPAVKDNHSVYLEGELEKAFGWQTVLSLGYVVDNIGAPLNQAVG